VRVETLKGYRAIISIRGGQVGSFSDEVVRKAWRRSKARCECRRSDHRWHVGHCIQSLIWLDAGKDTAGGWNVHHITPQEKGGEDTVENCEVLCAACHRAVASSG